MNLLLLLLGACGADNIFVKLDCVAEDLDGDRVAGRYVVDTTGEECVRELEAADCDDLDASVHPGALDTCERDRNCDGTIAPDADRDGYCGDDCDDHDPDVHPGAPERCNGLDDDCDGAVDEGLDMDGDGYRVCAGDCDDTHVLVHPDAVEICDGLDNDCDGTWDLGPETDADGDGVRACEGDCAEDDPSVHPGAADLCNGLDDDCSGELDPLDQDLDGDGWWGCEECDDTERAVHPGAYEACDGVDNNCDGVVDEGWDADGDGFAECDGDCDDGDATVYPGAAERCNGSDDDCDGATGSEEFDVDGDGVVECDGDCAPLDALVYPGAPEQCDGLDGNCDGVVGADEADTDADGALACDDCDDTDAFRNRLDLDRDGASSCDDDCDDLDAALESLDADGDGWSTCDGDCDDHEPGLFPGNPETCDHLDNDCDAEVDEGFVDLDEDGSAECVEICNGIDDDSDGAVDEGFEDGGWVGTWVDGTMPTGDGTATRPYAHIQDAVDNRSPVTPCPIYVRPATYFETVWVDGGDLVLVSTAGAEDTVIDAAGPGPAVYTQATSSGSRIEGFSLTGAVGGESGGLRAEDGHLDVIDNLVYGNSTTGSGAGIYCRNCVGTLSGNEVWGNRSEQPTFDYGVGGGIAVQYSGSEVVIEGNRVWANELESLYGFGGGIGLWATGEVWIEHNEILGNRSSYAGGGLSVRDGSVAYVLNNVFVGNAASSEAAAAIELQGDDGSWVINNTIVRNDEGWAQVMASWCHATDYLGNNIIAHSDIAGLATWGGTTPQMVYNDVWGNAAGEYVVLTDVTGSNGNISADPELTDVSDDGDPTNEDLALQSGSPAIDAGHPSSSFDDVDGTRNDMGAFGGPNGSWP